MRRERGRGARIEKMGEGGKKKKNTHTQIKKEQRLTADRPRPTLVRMRRAEDE